MKLELVIYPNKILEKVAEPIKEIKQKHKDLAASMHYWMGVWKGVGLAAPQVGRSLRIIVANDGTNKVTMFNPEIISTDEELVGMKEGCLSFSNIYYHIKRPKSLTVKFLDETGAEVTKTFESLMARIILHEIDHLQGITFEKRVDK